MRDKTKLIHAGRKPFENKGILNPPVYHASTILFEDLAGLEGKGENGKTRMRYGRAGTPTMLAVEEAICALEGGDECRTVPSGLAAITLVILSLAKQGQHILVSDSAYEPTRRLGAGLLKRLGIGMRFFDPKIGAGIESLIDENTGLVFLESPGSLTFELNDIPAIVKICKAKNIPTAIDNTWSAGVYLKPLSLGVDVSLQAATKYISGNSDLMMGIVTMKSGKVADMINQTWYEMGSVASPDTMFGVMRGLRSLNVRLNYHQAAGFEIANWLETLPEVAAVIHPGLPSHPQHELWKRDFTGASSLFSIVMHEKNHDKLTAMLNGMHYFKMGFSWGGYESLVTAFDLSHNRTASKWPYAGNAIRLHVGQEDIDDLKEDLLAGFERWQKA